MTTARAAPAAGDTARITLEGRITAYTVAPIWRAALETLSRNPNRPVRVDASRLEYVDDTGIALLFDLRRRERPQGAEVRIENLAPNLAALVDGYDPRGLRADLPPARGRRHRRARRPGHGPR